MGSEGDEDGDGGERWRVYSRGKVVNYYFNNFPNDWIVSIVCYIFAKIGGVVNVYVARKVNKEGRRFIFVRFFQS